METFLYYVNIYIIPISVIALLYVNVGKQVRNSIGRKYFRLVLLCVEIGIVSLVISRAPGNTVIGLVCIWAASGICLFFTVLACYVWLLYVLCLVKKTNNLRPYRNKLCFAAVPLVIYFVLLVTSLWHNLLYDVKISGEYVQGLFAWIPYVTAATYLFSSSCIAWIATRKELLEDQKREYQNLISFLILPIIGLLIQSYAHKYPAAIPCTVLALLIIYFDMLKGYSSLDSLTGLNNRRKFQQYLTAKFHAPNKENWGLIMIDLDGFKEINDTWGHTVGDEALMHMAYQLKYTFQGYKSFVARYGGDEFVAIVTCEGEEELQSLIKQFACNIIEFNHSKKTPFSLQYSLGYAMYRDDMKSTEEILHIADAEMYENKREHKEDNL